MKKWSKNEGEKFENSATCYGWEQNPGVKELNASRIAVNGNYPEIGTFAYNDEAHEMAYILSGSGSITVKGKEAVDFAVGDTVYFAPNERARWSGEFEMLTICSPAFDPKKHHTEDEK